MKIIKAALVIFFFCSFSVVYGQNKKTSFLVNGKCEMCEERIEKALDIKGVNFASWNVETKMCNVTFNQKKITEKEIHKILAEVGHDTPLCKASDEAYNGLHRCCHYTRVDSLK